VSDSVLKSSANLKSPEFEKNARRIIDLLTKIKNEEERIRQGAARRPSNRNTKRPSHRRERIAKLIDPGSQFFELGIYAAFEMYEEWGGAPCAARSRTCKSARAHVHAHRERCNGEGWRVFSR